jgi:hypothetical protein
VKPPSRTFTIITVPIVGIGVAVDVPVDKAVPVAVIVLDDVAVGVRVGTVKVGVTDAEAEPVGVLVAVAVAAAVIVLDDVAVGVRVAMIGVGVAVAVAEAVGVLVAVAEAVTVLDDVAVGVRVAVGVNAMGLGVAVGRMLVFVGGTVGVQAHAICARVSAPGMLSSPAPYPFGFWAAAPDIVADDRSALRTASRESVGNVDHTTAAAPATWGDAIDVPLS